MHILVLLVDFVIVMCWMVQFWYGKIHMHLDNLLNSICGQSFVLIVNFSCDVGAMLGFTVLDSETSC